MSTSQSVVEAVKVFPPVAAGSAWLAGIDMPWVAAALAATWTLLLIVEKVVRWVIAWRARRAS